MIIFIGSSSKAANTTMKWIAGLIKDSGHEPLRWDKKGLFKPGEYLFPRLIEISQGVEAAIFIFSEDDMMVSGDEVFFQTRDNVLVEFGLFSGRLGIKNAIICMDGKPKTSSDLLGLTYIDISEDKRKEGGEKIKNWLRELNTPEPVDFRGQAGEFTWIDVKNGIYKMVEKMKKDGYEPDLVIGIGRSGGIIGGLIAGYLNARPFRAINWNYQDVVIDGVKHRNHIFDNALAIEDKFKKILLVEGATTTGETPKLALEFFKDKFPDKEFCFAVLVRAESSTGPVKYVAYAVPVIKRLPWHVESWPTYLVHQIE